ncbi:MAG: hypothetical protein P4L99_20825 [Chthoniobacter sp.]|nr:hypothetical protein [Chthoniobacter sp.]
MKLDLAILQLLEAMPRPVPDTVIDAQLPLFYSGRFDLAKIHAALERLQASGDVHAQSRRFFGLLYTITPSGKAAIA